MDKSVHETMINDIAVCMVLLCCIRKEIVMETKTHRVYRPYLFRSVIEWMNQSLLILRVPSCLSWLGVHMPVERHGG